MIYSSAVKEGNKAFDAAIVAGIPLLRRAEALATLMQNKKGIVVAGTHGKTTSSALMAHVLRVGGLNPSHYVGAEIPANLQAVSTMLTLYTAPTPNGWKISMLLEELEGELSGKTGE